MLGYSFPKSWVSKLGLGKFRLYVAADNLLTLTKYDGYDPEVGSNGFVTSWFGLWNISYKYPDAWRIPD